MAWKFVKNLCLVSLGILLRFYFITDIGGLPLTLTLSDTLPLTSHPSWLLVCFFFILYSSVFTKLVCIRGLACIRRNKTSVNGASVNRHTHFFVPPDQPYWLHNALFTLLPPSLCCHYQTMCTRVCALAVRHDGERSPSAAVRGSSGCHDGLLSCNLKPQDLNPAFKHP